MIKKKKNTLPNGWTTTNLATIANINMGQSPPSSSYNTQGIGLPFFQGKTEFTAFYPTIKKYSSLPIKIADKNDILISVRAPIGPTNFAPTQSCIGRGLAGIKGYGEMSNRYLFYYFKSLLSDKIRKTVNIYTLGQ